RRCFHRRCRGSGRRFERPRRSGSGVPGDPGLLHPCRPPRPRPGLRHTAAAAGRSVCSCRCR
ncbi:hypothetical protein KMBAHK_KMBAHK_10095, partial [Dysosmobacter welbionis]